MEKGWGLTLENSDPAGSFLNKPVFGFNSSPRMNHNKGILFPVSLNGRVEPPAPPPENDKRVVLGEVDFFRTNNDHFVVKKEDSSTETAKRDFNVNTGLQLLTATTGSDQSTVDDGTSYDMEDKRAKNEFAEMKIELARMNAENQKLKGMLTQVSNNYSALQMHLMTLMQQQQISKTENTQENEIINRKSEEKKQENGGSMVPRQFLELVSGEEQSQSSSEERTVSESPNNNKELSRNKRIGREDSPGSKDWTPNKALKLNPFKPVDQSTEATMRKARVSVRARSEAPMISDGCQWRKYGQKMAKGNPCPRAYYRCTMAVGCPVRKQVQRDVEDQTILITTYEGTHNHPLPPAAMAMASTTSAAANMLLSGPMPSANGLMNPNFLARTILPCSSNMATISASAPFPTITLDLTHQSPNPLQFQRPPPQFQVPLATPLQSFAAVQPPQLPQVFGQPLYNQSKFSGLQVSQDTETSSLPNEPQQEQQHHQLPFANTLSAATAAITADPNFTAALAAAISSIIGGSNPNNNNSNADANTRTSNKINSFSGN